MDAILHVGVTKTGTTTIQKFLRDNREPLGRQGILVPSSPMAATHFGQHVGLVAFLAMRAGDTDNARWAARSLFERKVDIQTGLRQMWEEFLREVGEAAGYRQTILSSEGLVRFGRTEFADLRGLLSGLFDRITVLVYLRRQDLHAVSLFTSLVRLKIPVTSLFPDPPPASHKYDALLGDLAHVFGHENVKVRLFERGRMKGGDSLADFRSVCDIEDDPAFVVPLRQNEKLNAKQTAFLHSLQQVNGDGPLPDMRIGAILDTLQSDTHFMPSKAEAQAYYRQFAEGNASIARDYFGTEGPLFDEDFSMYPDESDINDFITPDDMARAMTSHLIMEAKVRRKARKARRLKKRREAR